jgi:hypothetical protein
MPVKNGEDGTGSRVFASLLVDADGNSLSEEDRKAVCVWLHQRVRAMVGESLTTLAQTLSA